jgi:prolyl 3-hydroxylase /prolyl 3,4-dihydroxylase
MIEQFSDSFTDTSVLQLSRFFKESFAAELRDYITKAERDTSLASSSAKRPIARPPHKHRYAYMQSSESLHADPSPIARILTDLIHAHAFKKWLALVTGLKTASLVRQDTLARRFRRGKDYALASPYVGEMPQLEFTIGITPSEGWERDDEEGAEEDGGEKALDNSKNAKENGKGNGETSSKPSTAIQVSTSTLPEFGGEEVYMAGDDDDADGAADSAHDKALPQVGKKADPAIYRADEDEDGGILFSAAPNWNSFSVVLRDKGTLRFVKYVSSAARGDRWDVKGCVELSGDAFDEEEGEGQDGDTDGSGDEGEESDEDDGDE